LGFANLGLYYVHGRWYNQDTGLFPSPDEKGEYFYGSGNDAINYAWVFLSGTGCEFFDAELLGALRTGAALEDLLNGPRGYYYQYCLQHQSETAYLQGSAFGRNLSTDLSLIEITAGGIGGGGSLLAEVPSGGTSTVGVSVGLVGIMHGGAVALRNEGVDLGQIITFARGAGTGEWRPLGEDDRPPSYQSPKGGPRKVTVQNGPYRGRSGWLDKDGNIWVPSRPGESHGGPHWDVQIDGGKGGHINVYP
jgi:hypothetical protein